MQFGLFSDFGQGLASGLELGLGLVFKLGWRLGLRSGFRVEIGVGSGSELGFGLELKKTSVSFLCMIKVQLQLCSPLSRLTRGRPRFRLLPQATVFQRYF